MQQYVPRPPSTVGDWSDARRKMQLRRSRPGHAWRRFGRTRRALMWLGLSMVPVLIVGGQYWIEDVQPERERLALTQPAVHAVYDAKNPADRRTAVVDLVGLGNVDATATARSLSAYTGLGQVWAVEYDNSGIDTKVISDLIVDHAAATGTDNLILSGHSMGGVVALEVAQHIYEDTGTLLAGVVLDCTPVDLHAVRGDMRDAGEDMLRWVGWLPGARESRSLRVVVETAARKDRFLDSRDSWFPRVDLSALGRVFGEVLRDKVLSEDAASNGLIESQFKVIVASGAIDNLKSLATERDGKPLPAVVFVRPRDGRFDPVVDVDYTQRILVEQSGGVDGTLLVAKLDGIGHANPIQQPAAYNAAIENRIEPFLREILPSPPVRTR
ncbi:alpha/beta fold hydrolase [Rhodococcus tibetensis]|uniref:Alpha/beta hydrolase n=1 Tax=Rhodococcus tibetensis TaxID=2965064 RepID=A0ABT1QHS7_9NOCA|nr:alpha/beta hydrolase [Rhodococcus sp. FXJ9.536]MCQ4121747.1 alpha/beta hydrolase [Rhodococcus sp. FXJ9.536]